MLELRPDTNNALKEVRALPVHMLTNRRLEGYVLPMLGGTWEDEKFLQGGDFLRGTRGYRKQQHKQHTKNSEEVASGWV